MNLTQERLSTGPKVSAHRLSELFHLNSNTFELRLKYWNLFKTHLSENQNSILKDTILFWRRVQKSPLSVDPYDQNTWPTPWELLEENIYCNFSQLLAIAYTIMLAVPGDQNLPIIHIGFDKTQSRMYYILYIMGQFLSVSDDKNVEIVCEFPKDLQFQKTHTLKKQY